MTLMPKTDMPTPVTDSLASDLGVALQRKGVVVWVDPTGDFTPYVDNLVARHAAGAYPHPVLGFRGSWLAWIQSLGDRPDGLDPVPLLLHLPGLTVAGLRDTPAFPWLEVGGVFDVGLAEAVRKAAAGRTTTERTETYLQHETLTLAAADAWLATEISAHEADRDAIYTRVSPEVLLDDLLARTSHKPSSLPTLRLDTVTDIDALARHLHVALGMDPAWRDFCDGLRGRRSGSPDVQLERLTLDWLSWILCVEYVTDLEREPYLPALVPLRALPEGLKARCVALVVYLRKNHAEAYPSFADEAEQLVRDRELSLMRPEELGGVDTFRYEEQRVLETAVTALRERRWDVAVKLADKRLGAGRSFWLHQSDAWSQSRRWMWTLVDEAARLGVALKEAQRTDELTTGTLEEATEIYAAKLAWVDGVHRRFEQRLKALLDPRMEHYGALQDVVARLRELYRAWADKLARAFTARCREHGFLPEARYQQRTIYEQVVHPRVERGQRVAVFLVDALRYEMAMELAEALAGEGRAVDLKPRLAELPTITAVGMNALPPVSRHGRLDVAGNFGGFRAGEFTVSRPDDRARAIGQRSLGKTKALLLDLSEVCAAAPEKELAKQVAQRKVIVVQSREIDDAGEVNLGVRTFESTLRDLVAAWHLLQAAGVDVCVFTADHGFLLQDGTTESYDFGTRRDPQRRYVHDAYPRKEDGMAWVALSSLGYDNIDGYLLFREDTAVFAAAGGAGSFVHGGNSLQERVIPVLVVEGARTKNVSSQAYVIATETLTPVLGLHRVKLRVTQAPGASPPKLAIERDPPMDICLRVQDRDDVRVLLRDVSGAGALRGGRMQLETDAGWTEVFFALEGARDERVQVEFFHPDNPKRVGGGRPEGWFDVSGVGKGIETAKPVRVAPGPPDWSLPMEEGVRAIFVHLAQHGSITESEATAMLKGARAFRKFSLEFEQHAERVPFKIRIETGGDGKRYVKEVAK